MHRVPRQLAELLTRPQQRALSCPSGPMRLCGFHLIVAGPDGLCRTVVGDATLEALGTVA